MDRTGSDRISDPRMRFSVVLPIQSDPDWSNTALKIFEKSSKIFRSVSIQWQDQSGSIQLANEKLVSLSRDGNEIQKRAGGLLFSTSFITLRMLFFNTFRVVWNVMFKLFI